MGTRFPDAEIFRYRIGRLEDKAMAGNERAVEKLAVLERKYDIRARIAHAALGRLRVHKLAGFMAR